VTGRDAAAAIAVWALFIAALAGLLLAFTTTDAVNLIAFWAAVTWIACVALLAMRGRDPERRRVPEASASAVVVAVGVALLVIGAGIGLWAALLGAGVLLVGLAFLVRERAG
jgi:formate hydrogenlyase subunit 3/multisubunit Na+/H+ antiporter MnhD subunit